MADPQVIYAVPTVQIERRGLGYDVTVLTERHGPCGGFGERRWAWTRRGAERVARQILADSTARRASDAMKRGGGRG